MKSCLCALWVAERQVDAVTRLWECLVGKALLPDGFQGRSFYGGVGVRMVTEVIGCHGAVVLDTGHSLRANLCYCVEPMP